MNYGIKLKSLNNIKKTYESSISRSKLASLSHGNLSSRNNRTVIPLNEKKQLKLACAFHSEQRITNFCRSKGCLLPLCPRCVTIHTQEHIKLGVYGEFTTIEDQISESEKQIRLSLREISQLQTTMIHKRQDFQAQMTAGKQKIKSGRIQIHQKVDQIFDILENSWSDQISLLNKKMLEEIEHVQDYLPSLIELANVGLMKLKNTQYVLEAVITNFSFLEEVQKLEAFQQSISKQDIQRITINIQDQDLNGLVDSLSKYITWGEHNDDVWKYIQAFSNQSGERRLSKPNKSLKKMIVSNKREKLREIEEDQQKLINSNGKAQRNEKGLTLNLSLDNFKSPLENFSLEDIRRDANLQP